MLHVEVVCLCNVFLLFYSVRLVIEGCCNKPFKALSYTDLYFHFQPHLIHYFAKLRPLILKPPPVLTPHILLHLRHPEQGPKCEYSTYTDIFTPTDIPYHSNQMQPRQGLRLVGKSRKNAASLVALLSFKKYTIKIILIYAILTIMQEKKMAKKPLKCSFFFNR